MKKIAMLLVVCLVLGCAGCGGEKTYEDTLQQILDDVKLETTAAPLALGGIREEDWERYVFGPLVVQEMVERQSNPIALFHALVDQGVYLVDSEGADVWMDVLAEELMEGRQTLRDIPDVRLWEDREGPAPEDLLCEVLRMSAMASDGAPMESALLNQYEHDLWDFFHYSTKDQCYYCYSICYDNYYAYILAVYLRETNDERYLIDDVEIQFLRLAYREGGWAGSGLSGMYAYCEWESQAAGLICSLEKLMTGRSLLLEQMEGSDGAEGYQLPESYELGDYSVELQKKSYTNPMSEGVYYDSADLINYRIHK